MRRVRAVFSVGCCFAGLVAAYSQCTLRVTSVRPCLAGGKSGTPRLGDQDYGVRVEWDVEGQPSGPYNVKFSMADRSWVWKGVKASGPGHYWGYALFHLPLDGIVPYTVEVDCDHQTGATSQSQTKANGQFTPTPPASIIEFYDPKTWVATQAMNVVIPENSRIATISYMFAIPTSESFEQIVADDGVAGMSKVDTGPFGYALWRKQVPHPSPGTVDISRSFAVQSSSVRANLEPAMAHWSAYDRLPADIARYLKPEETVQCASSPVKEFVAAALPPKFHEKMSPYDAAKALFMAAAGRLTYETPADSDALSGLKKNKGDCGTYASLYVASLRAIGIPARCVCGWRSGKDQWHCWAEMYVPGAGWMPQDPTDCNSIWVAHHSSGKFAYCFATVPDLNSRVVVSRGSTFTTDEGTWHTMQPGQWGVWGPENLTFPTWTSSCSLVPKG